MRRKLLFTLIASLYAQHAFANVSNDISLSGTSNNYLFPLAPRASLWGGMGNNNYGRLDVMAPLFGNPDGIVYADVDGEKGSSDMWYASAGLGVRDAINDNLLWGAYGFLDHANTGTGWEVINPGLEIMTNQWDARINGYFPIGKNKDKQFIGTQFGDQVTDPTLVFQERFQYHTQYDQQFNVYQTEEIPNGVDADAGYTFASMYNARAHAGVYYYGFADSQLKSIQGVEGGIEFPVNNYVALEFNDAYDKTQRNTAIVSLRLTAGGIDKSAEPNNVANRILDPLHRHFGALATSSGIPSQILQTEDVLNNGQLVLERSNIWFFTGSSGTSLGIGLGPQDCTYENPCAGSSFNQTNANVINAIAPNANFYFTPGIYNDLGIFNLNKGQSMYGRTADYKNPASSQSGFAIFGGTLKLEGNNVLDSFEVGGDPTATHETGIDIQNSNNIQMNNLIIGDPTFSNYQTGINLNNTNNISLTNSTINTVVNTTVSSAGDIVSANGNITASNDTFNMTSTINAGGDITNIYNSSGTISVNNSQFSITSSHTINGGSDTNVFNINSGTVNLNNNTLVINSSVGSSNPLTISVASIESNGGGNVSASHNSFTLNVTNTATPTPSNYLTAIGLLNNSSTITANNNTFSITAPKNFATIGIQSSGDNTTTTNANNNVFNIANTGGSPMVGIENSIDPSTTFNGSNNSFIFTGAGFTCTAGPINGTNNTCT